MEGTAVGTVTPTGTCVVCSEVEPGRRHLNYGADVCRSCRAFFRRIHCGGTQVC